MSDATSGGRRINWMHVLTVVSAAILIGAEVFGAFNTYSMGDVNDAIKVDNSAGANFDQLSNGIGGGLGTIASTIHAYPTFAELARKAGDKYNKTRLTPRAKKIFIWLYKCARK